VLILDANILIHAVLGVRVRTLIARYGAVADLFAPDTHGLKRENIFRRSSGSAAFRLSLRCRC
jgi:hypothetical protein